MSTETNPFRCSDEARRRGDPIVGTAPPARRWLLVELEGRWLPTALTSLVTNPATRAALDAIASAAGARIMLIRRHGRRQTSPRRSWCVVDDPRTARGPITTWGTWTVADDLIDPATLLKSQAADAGEFAQSTQPRQGTPERRKGPEGPQGPNEPELLLVCTHGKHDVCCATRGRPVADALTRRWPEATWECSHTGGDRFAANVIALPDGACYGGLDPDVVVPVIDQHFAAGPNTSYLRGWTGRTPAEQAAVVAAHRALPEQRWGSIDVTGVLTREHDCLVQLSSQAGPLAVPVIEVIREPHQLTCAALRPNRATVPVAGQVQRQQV
ncbi:MAG: sucrase ferredoxin [Ornithinimicrobium sp.]